MEFVSQRVVRKCKSKGICRWWWLIIAGSFGRERKLNDLQQNIAKWNLISIQLLWLFLCSKLSQPTLNTETVTHLLLFLLNKYLPSKWRWDGEETKKCTTYIILLFTIHKDSFANLLHRIGISKYKWGHHNGKGGEWWTIGTPWEGEWW